MKTTSSKVSRISDKAIVNDLAGRVFSASRRKLPIIIAFFYYILKFLLSVAAYVPRCILRKKLGERTFGVITIASVYLFLSFVQIMSEVLPKVIQSIKNGFRIYNFNLNDGASWYDTISQYLFITASSQGEEVAKMIQTIALTSIFRDSILKYQGLSTGLQFLWWITLAFSLMHFIELFLRRIRNETIHSFHRGRPALSLLSGKKMIWIEINDKYLWMIVEPLIVFLFAITVDFFFGLELLASVLKISALCLFFEEYRVYMENKSMVLDLIDSQIDGMKLAHVQEEYMEKLNFQKGQDHTKEGFINTVVID